MRHSLALAAALFAAGCATAPRTVGELPAADALRDFGLEARFALRIDRPYEATQSAAGRLSWEHTGGHDRVLVANPLGQGIAEIETSAAGAELRTANGQIKHAADAATLLEENTGYPLPLGELPNWLLGRPGPQGELSSDAAGRPVRLSDSGWHIEYEYDGNDTLPARLVLRRGREVELRLRIEEWRSAP